MSRTNDRVTNWMRAAEYVGAVLIGLSVAGVAAGQDRDAKVRNDRDKFADQSTWTYNNYPQAREAARRSGKPILAVLRCIP